MDSKMKPKCTRKDKMMTISKFVFFLVALALAVGVCFYVHNQTVDDADVGAPTVTLCEPVKQNEDGSLSFVVEYADDEEIKNISLAPEDCQLRGFEADVIVEGEGLMRTIILQNPIATDGDGSCYVYIAGGTGIDDQFNLANPMKTNEFSIPSQD